MRVHVICGGGTGTRLLLALDSLGAELSAGPLSPEDTDARTILRLGGRWWPTEPSREGSPWGIAEVRPWAEAVVVTPFAVGQGNVAHLDVAADLARHHPLYILEGADITHRDYTGGTATQRMRGLEATARARVRGSAALAAAILRDLSSGPAEG